MFSRLTLLLILLSFKAYALSEDELIKYSDSEEWKKYLYLDDGKSLILGDRYFIGQNKTNPKIELTESIDAFRNNKKNSKGISYHCLFPARFLLLKKKWLNEFPQVFCSDFEEFKKGIDIKNVYLVFTSAYPNNPASMFGHTFLRFDRKSIGEIKTTKEILGYSAAFQARTNPSDNAIMYTLKGILGGYQTYIEIKPQYINIGVYNNGESRDTWSQKLNLTELEVEFLIAHMWELSISGAFPYYFFDENCSTYLLRLLEVIRPSLNFKSKDDIFVVPQVAYREITQKLGHQKALYRPSLKKEITHNYRNLSEIEKKKFNTVKHDLNDLKKENSIRVLDTLVDYWKLKNYQAGTNLISEEKELMYQAFLQRSQFNGLDSKSDILVPEQENPAFGHKLSRYGIGAGSDLISLNFRYGFHSFDDFENGFDNNSFIKLFDTDLFLNKSDIEWRTDLVDILSLQEYTSFFRELSWRVRLRYEDLDDEFINLQTSVGLSTNTTSKLQLFSLVGVDYFSHNYNRVFGSLNLGAKMRLSEKIRFVYQGMYYQESLNPRWEGQINYLNKDTLYFLNLEQLSHENQLQIGISKYW